MVKFRDFKKISKKNFKKKFIIAIILDALDIVFAPIPIVNSIWDIATAYILSKYLRHPYWAGLSLSELALPGLPLTSLSDTLLPLATVIVILDEIVE